MPGRSISTATRTWLAGEIDFWRAGRLISEDQAAVILGLYETPGEIAGRQRSKAVLALMGVAALLVGLAVLLLIGYNWEAMPRELKLVTIFGVIGITYGTSFWLRYRRGARLLSEVGFFLGSLFYGCGIWLIAQIFHIQSHYPEGLWLWALGVLPIALALETPLVHALLVALLATWVGTEILDFDRLFRPLLFGRWFAVPGACYTLPLFALAGLAWAYRKRSSMTVGLYVPLVAWWLVLQPISWHHEVNPVYFIAAVGALLLMAAEAHRPGDRMAIPYRLYGVLISAGTLVPLSFLDFNRHVIGRGDGALYVLWAILIALAGVVGVCLLASVRAAWDRQQGASVKPFQQRYAETLRRQWLPVSLLLLMAGLTLWNAPFATAGSGAFRPGYGHSGLDRWSLPVVVPTLAANAALVVLAFWLMRVGLREDRGRPFAAGVLLFLAWAVFRYSDLFGGIGGMLGAAAMFFICGAALFGVARYWHHRKEIPHV